MVRLVMIAKCPHAYDSSDIYNPCGCSTSNDSHCMYCCRPSKEHGWRGVYEWKKESLLRFIRGIFRYFDKYKDE